MKISKNKILKISDLVEEIKMLDEVIKQHKEANDSSSIISQYEHRKLKFYNELKLSIFC